MASGNPKYPEGTSGKSRTLHLREQLALGIPQPNVFFKVPCWYVGSGSPMSRASEVSDGYEQAPSHGSALIPHVRIDAEWAADTLGSTSKGVYARE
jgi:hypothetical protein